MVVEKKKYYEITSLVKGIKILELLVAQPSLSVSEAAARLGINRAAAHRFLATLRDLGYAEKNEDNRYQSTVRILELGMKVAGRFEIRQEARRFMQELSAAFKETVNLGFWDGKAILHLDKIDSSEILRIDAPLGSKTPAFCTALGKAVLAHLPAEELDSYLDRTRLAPHGPNTIVSKEKLREQLKKIRRRGYAVDNEELARGLRCVAAPVFDHTGRARFALSISCPSLRLRKDAIGKMQLHIRDVCRRLSARLGYRSADTAEAKN
jgi:DNA-binding IclR family transcriptional regulator